MQMTHDEARALDSLKMITRKLENPLDIPTIAFLDAVHASLKEANNEHLFTMLNFENIKVELSMSDELLYQAAAEFALQIVLAHDWARERWGKNAAIMMMRVASFKYA